MSGQNSSYKKLFSNTLLFALGSFTSKVLIILLVKVYTTYLTKDELGVNEILQQISNWMIPLVTLTVSEAVLRFGIDKAYDKKQIFSIANVICTLGILCMVVIIPLFVVLRLTTADISLWLFFYIAAAAVKLVYMNFLRALDKVRLYAYMSIINTLITLVGTILFICVFKMGNYGYLLSIIIADALTAVISFFAAKMWQYVDFRHIKRENVKMMLAYCVPLIPAQIMWLVTNSSDSFMTKYYMGDGATGVLSASYKIANLVSTVYLMFGQAWNMSAIMEDGSDDRDEFYSNVYRLNLCMLFILAAGCLFICTPLTYIWMGEQVWESAKYAPILIYSTIFSCLATFMGSIYLASNRTKRSLMTSVVAGVINISLNLVLIPRIGLYGPPITTVVSYIAVFAVRAYDSRKLVPFDLKTGKLVRGSLILALMTLVSTAMHSKRIESIEHSYPVCMAVLFVMFIAVTAMNIKPVWDSALRIAPVKIRHIAGKLNILQVMLLIVAAMGYAVLCYLKHMVFVWTCIVIFAAAAAYGIAGKKRLLEYGGLCGIFLAVLGGYGAAQACFAAGILAFIELVRTRGRVICALWLACVSGLVGAVCGIWWGVFVGDILLLIYVICNLKAMYRSLCRTNVYKER